MGRWLVDILFCPHLHLQSLFSFLVSLSILIVRESRIQISVDWILIEIIQEISVVRALVRHHFKRSVFLEFICIIWFASWLAFL